MVWGGGDKTLYKSLAESIIDFVQVVTTNSMFILLRPKRSRENIISTRKCALYDLLVMSNVFCLYYKGKCPAFVLYISNIT